MAIVWLRNSRDVSEKTISGPGGSGKTAAGNEKPRSFGVQRVVTTLLSVGRFCKAICNSFLEQAHFFPIFVVQSATAGCLDCTRNLVNFRKQSSAYPALRCGLRRMARDMIPTSLRRGLYVLIAFKVYQNPVWNKQTVVRVRIFTGAAQRSPKSTPP